MNTPRPRVALFVTCLVDLYRPTIGFAAIRLLEAAGCQVEVPPAQTCCGQPAYNSGDREGARAIAAGLVGAFAGYDYVVAPSGSCAAMLRVHLPGLFADDPDLRAPVAALAAKSWELTSFLVDKAGMTIPPATASDNFAYHDSCSGLRDLGVRAQPRALLAAAGAAITELADPEPCCGFGGTFCVKYPAISARMATDKAQAVTDTKAPLLLGGDLGCLLNLAGLLARQGSPIAVRHVAELLAGMSDDLPPIGAPRPAART